MKKTGIIIGVVIVIALVVVAVMMYSGNLYSNSSNSTSKSSSSSSATAAATIIYSDNGFSPDVTTVKSGDTVTVKNTSNSALQFESNPHPVHTDDTDLNAGSVDPGKSISFTVTKRGTFGFHNHLAPSHTAKIVIQ